MHSTTPLPPDPIGPSTSTDRRRVLAGAGLGIASLALPSAVAHASTATPAALVGADAFAFTSPGYVDLVADMDGTSGTESAINGNRWHLGYAFVAISIDGFRLFGNDGTNSQTNSTFVHIAVAAEPDTFGGFPDAIRYSFTSPNTPSFTADDETTGTFTATTIPAGHHFLIAMGGANAGRASITSAPSRIATAGGQQVLGLETGYWQSTTFDSAAAKLNTFTRANRAVDGAMDRVGWRVTIAP